MRVNLAIRRLLTGSCLIFILLFWVGPIAAQSALDALAADLVEKLLTRQDIAGKTLQFREQDCSGADGGGQTDFDRALYSALLVRLTRAQAMVTVHTPEGEPLRLDCRHRREKDFLVVTLGLARMAVDGSVELLRVEQQVAYLQVAELLKKSLQSVTAGLVRQLERGYPGPDGAAVTVLQPVPALKNKPTLRLGKALRQLLTQELTRSTLFGGVVLVGGSGRPLNLLASYVAGDPVQIIVQLQDASGRVFAYGNDRLSRVDIPPELLEPIDDQNRTVCIGYRPQDAHAVGSDSPVVPILMSRLADSLNGAGIAPNSCGQAPAAIAVRASLSLQSRRLPDGYSLLQANLNLTLESGGKTVGVVAHSTRMPGGSSNCSSQGQVVEKLFTPGLRSELAEKILACHP